MRRDIGQINIKLDKDFRKQANKLIRKYGDKMAELNGFAGKQLGYTEFIDNFVDKQTVADASIDGNANVGTKDVCSLLSEMNKPHSKLLAFNKRYRASRNCRNSGCACRNKCNNQTRVHYSSPSVT